ncbi:hypothetical protein EVAR_51146_1 [Eumeta japonica]|uniref:Uncharacterized protein n=1 Tax=Eumeta variegata TaxID=151549 RepID=A0A4C1YJV3_EUMVA|nr:hypothetical protein EVAR_51146_1 [Eumeta japonica]
MFSVACERFYSRLDDIKNNCAVVLDLPPEQFGTACKVEMILREASKSESRSRMKSKWEVRARPSHLKGASRNTTKNILRLCEARFSKMRVCGLFAVDAALPLRLMGLVATYCIVLLQFALL